METVEGKGHGRVIALAASRQAYSENGRTCMFKAKPMLKTLTIAGSLACALLSIAVVSATAQPADSGGQYRLLIGFGVGGGYDIWGRTVVRHMSKYIPGNPIIVPQNVPAAGSLVAASTIYDGAPRDGTVFALIGRDAPLGPITNQPGARFEPAKMSWIGTPTRETNVCVAYHTAAVKTAKDLYHHELIMGDVGPGSGTRIYPKALSGLLGMKFKLVGGYKSSGDVMLAMQRNEVQGICESFESIRSRRPDWLEKKTVAILFQGAAEASSDLPGIPMIQDLARNVEERQAIEFLYAGQSIGRPFVAPPGLPPDRLAILRKAFDATMKDPEFIADVKRQKLDLDPIDGEMLGALINKIYATPKSVVDRVSGLVN
jgi:tripartite-type tricarboxylate transporter receptor subunit TctC